MSTIFILPPQCGNGDRLGLFRETAKLRNFTQLARTERQTAGKRFLELGRSCVDAQYRSKRVIELLWRGLWVYAKHHRIDVLIGCASLPGVDPLALALPLSFMHQYALADEEWRIRPLAGRGSTPRRSMRARA